MRFGSQEHTVEVVNKGSGSNNHISIGDSAFAKRNNTDVQMVMETSGKAVRKIIESGSDIISAPATWLKAIQQNWLIYMVLFAIILSSIAFLYCVIVSYLNRQKKNWSNSNLFELAKVISNRNGALQQPLPLPAINPLSNLSNLPL